MQVYGDVCPGDPLCKAFHLDRKTKLPSAARPVGSSSQSLHGFFPCVPPSFQEQMNNSLLWKLSLGFTGFPLRSCASPSPSSLSMSPI